MLLKVNKKRYNATMEHCSHYNNMGQHEIQEDTFISQGLLKIFQPYLSDLFSM